MLSLILLPLLFTLITALSFDPACYEPSDVLNRSVLILGGGSTGTYAAISLAAQHISLAVVERDSRLGGHTHSYIVPGTKQSIDTGVVVFHNTTIVRDYLTHLGVPFLKSDFLAPTQNKYADFRTGQEVPYSAPAPADLATGLQVYLSHLQKYPYLQKGFELPDPVPDELLITFETFMKKYPAVQPAFEMIKQFGQGMGDVLRQPMLYVMKNFGVSAVTNMFSGGFLNLPNHFNSALYEAAHAKLGSDVLLSSSIVGLQRDENCVRAVVNTPTGHKLIVAEKLLSSIPPTLENLAGWDLSDKEKTLFGQFRSEGYYVGLLKNAGIPNGLVIHNIAANGSDLERRVPALPGLYSLRSNHVAGLSDVKFGAPYPVPEEEVKVRILESVERLRATGVIQGQPTGELEIVGFESHTPFELTVGVEAVKAGFYRKLNKLQGEQRTWWTGGAWHTHSSSLLWDFTKGVVGRLVEV